MSQTLIQKIALEEIAHLPINYAISETRFGAMLTAATPKGLCYIGFAHADKDALADLKSRLPKADFVPQSDAFQQQAVECLQNKTKQMPPFHLKGTDFQIAVWNALLKIPFGKQVAYQDIARTIGNPKACRAVGTAIGMNPVVVLIPCHRVLRSSGDLGGFYWGLDLKKMILNSELYS